MSEAASDVRIETPHHALEAYLATPSGQGPHPGVVVLHDAFGMTPVARGHADWLAREGFAAVVPDLYSWGGKFRCVRATIADIAARRGVAFDDVAAVRDWLSQRSECTGRIGVIGFCMGGGFAILLASGHGFSAAAPNYGEVPEDIEQVLQGACPVVGSFGKKDRLFKGAAARLEAALETRGIEHDVVEYPESGHSFMDDHEGLFQRAVGLVLGLRFHEADAADARGRISGFFRRHLA